MDLSILIPSNKPLHFIEAVIDSVAKSHQFYPDYSYEFIIYSREKPNRPNVVWVDENLSEQIPMVQVYNKLFWEVAKGDFIFISADDYAAEPSFFSLLKYAKSNPNQVIAPEHRGHPHYNALHSTWPILGCPIISREFIKNHLNNFIFHPRFKYHYSDNYLSIYLGVKGMPGQVMTMSGLNKLINHATNTSNDDVDRPVYDYLVENLKNNPTAEYVE